MNVAMAVPSQEAPPSWKNDAHNSHQIQALRKELLKGDPDVLALQECPGNGVDWANALFVGAENDDDTGYVAVASARAHAGQVILMVRTDMETWVSPITTELPAAIVKVNVAHTPTSRNKNRPSFTENRTFNEFEAATEVFVASVHLEPFERGSYGRRSQVEELLEVAASGGTATTDNQAAAAAVVFAGDTNMRDNEDITIEEELNLVDVWKVTGSYPPNRYTWDTTAHHKKVNGQTIVQQNQYHGSDTRPYRRRYDCIYMSHPAAELLHTQSFSLLANQPIPPSRSHFLSDHFGVAAEFAKTKKEDLR